MIYRRIRRLALAAKRPVRVLDIATGSGDLPIYWAKRAAKERLAIHCTGVDISDVAIAVGREEAAKANVAVDFIQRDVLRERLPSGYDIVTCGLFMHHLEIAQIRQLLLSMQSVHQMAIIICDLERSMLNLACVWVAAHSLSRCPIVHRDAVRSVKAALTREEFQRIVEQTLGRTLASVDCHLVALWSRWKKRVKRYLRWSQWLRFNRREPDDKQLRLGDVTSHAASHTLCVGDWCRTCGRRHCAAFECGRRNLSVGRTRTLPRFKVCGCCLNLAALSALKTLELDHLLTSQVAKPLNRWELRVGNRSIMTQLPGGIAISRGLMDQVLLEEAIRRGVQVQSGCEAKVIEVADDGVLVELRTTSELEARSHVDHSTSLCCGDSRFRAAGRRHD